MSTPPNDRRTMPPLPAAGMHPMAHNESLTQNDSSEQDRAAVPPQSGFGSGPEAYANTSPKSTAINMALSELQGDLESPEPSTSPNEPARPAHEQPELSSLPPTSPPAAAEGGLTPPPSATERAPLPESGSRADDRETGVGEPAPVPAAGAMSSTPPIAGRLERPGQRPPTPGAPGSQPGSENRPSHTTALVATAVASLLIGLLGAWAYDRFIRESKPEDEPALASSKDAPAVSPPGLSAAELEPLKTQLGALGEQVTAFEKQLEEVSSKAAAPPDLAPIRQQLEGVAKSITALDPLSKRLDDINTRMEGLETSVNGLKEELGSLEIKAAEPEKGAAAPTSAPTNRSGTPTAVPAATEPGEPAPLTLESANGDADANLADKAFSEGVELFNSGKYPLAYNVFEKLAKTKADDARVWYYAALSHGWARGDWGEATMNLVKRGVELEKAGSPKTSEIDAAFRDLSSGAGKEWLELKRKDAVK